MKKTNHLRILISFVAFIYAMNAIAQDTIILSAALLTPDSAGYYIAGVDVLVDGVMEHHDGCDDFYEDEDFTDGYNPQINHQECGTQFGFQYHNCLIMPTCPPKYDPIDPPMDTGYIQLAACLYSGTDSVSLSYIISPRITNLVSMTLETSADVSINAGRQIPYNIHFSSDNGTTWDPSIFITDHVAEKGGYRATYDSDDLAFNEMINASNTGEIVLRIMTNDRNVASPDQGQYVKVHKITIIADTVPVVSVNSPLVKQEIQISVNERTIISKEDIINVYSFTGQLIGTGKSILVPAPGIYLVTSENKAVKKIFVK